MNTAELSSMSKQVRRDIINMTANADSGHPGGSLSAADLMTCLFFNHMHVDPKHPDDPDRDRFVLSKGHAAPCYYAVLAEMGFISRDEFKNFRQLHSILQGHPDSKKVPGVDAATGSLGQGCSIAVGMALGAKVQHKDCKVYTLLGDGGPGLFLLGVRENPAEPFRYLRVPADDQGSIQGVLRMRLALQDPAAREEAVRRYTALAVDSSRKDIAEQLAQSAARALTLYAGGPGENGEYIGGLPAISQFMEKNVPEAERNRASEVLVRILNGTLFELAQLTRERAGLKPLESNDQTLAFMTQAVLSLSDAQIYPAPLAFELQDFNLYYVTRYGLAPSKVAFLVWHAWKDAGAGAWPPHFPEETRKAYDLAAIKHWLGVFLFRFFEISQFKRSAMPNGPKVIG